MKKAVLLLSFLVFTYCTSAQFRFTVYGEIKKPQRDYIIFGYNDRYFLNFKTDTIRLNADNSFNINESSNSYLVLANIEVTPEQSIQVYCVANQKLKLIVSDSLKNYAFKGSLTKINEYISDDQKHFEKVYNRFKQKHPDIDKLADEHSDLYYAITDSITVERLSFLENYFSTPQDSFEKELVSQKRQELVYSNLTYKLTYDNPAFEKFAYYQHQSKNDHTGMFYMFSDKVTFNDTSLLNNPMYLNFTRWFFMQLVFRFQRDENVKLFKEGFYDKMFFFINQFSSDKLCNAVIKASFINDEIKTMSLDSSIIDTVYGRFVDSLQSYNSIPVQAAIVKNNFNHRIADLLPLKPGTKFPNCILTDEKGDSFSLDNLKGKLVYIDVWASWCGKCLETMPSWNRLVNKFRNNSEIAFVTISTDVESDKVKWLKLLDKWHISGLRLISIGGQNSEFARKFYVNSYPTNILLDKDGTIISLHAPRPDEINITNYLK